MEGFDRGDEALNRFLMRFALANNRARASRTYVVLAVAVEHQGRGLGAALLKDAIGRTPGGGDRRHPRPGGAGQG